MKKQLNVRLEEDELEAIREAAYISRVSMTMWVRLTLMQTAEKVKEEAWPRIHS